MIKNKDIMKTPCLRGAFCTGCIFNQPRLNAEFKNVGWCNKSADFPEVCVDTTSKRGVRYSIFVIRKEENKNAEEKGHEEH